MNYLSVCSGIEAVSVAWRELGFSPLGFSEIDVFPNAVLQHHFPTIPNLGDITKYKDWHIDETIDIIIGGTPCQSFSVAGKRKGLDDSQGQLMYSYLGIIEKYKPKWVIWENVPGVLSIDKGLAFAELLCGLEERGYGWAYRVLDAQYFGVPQRRRRVFVVGHIGGKTECAATVLFERHCLQGNTKAGRKKGKNSSSTFTQNTGKAICFEPRSFDGVARVIGDISPCLNTMQGRQRQPCIIPYSPSSFGQYSEGIGSLRASGGDVGQGSEVLINGFNMVRRITPKEAERLQGFPDDWTKIPYRGKTKEQCPDSPRYKAIGNSMAVPVIRWIGEKIKRKQEVNYGKHECTEKDE